MLTLLDHPVFKDATTIGWCATPTLDGLRLPGFTFNPWIGCRRHSPGCVHCYAESWARRAGRAVWANDPRERTSAQNWAKPLKWNQAAAELGVRLKVFCASLADVFEDHPLLDPWRADLWALIEATPNLDWLLLTKRPERILDCVPAHWRTRFPANVWVGTSVEDNDRLYRLDELLQVPARVRFVSYEPALEYVNFSRYLVPPVDLAIGKLHWVIVGGESGAGARRCELNWLRNTVRDCDRDSVACFVKQTGSRAYYNGQRVRFRDSKGETSSEWPLDLQVQQWPEVQPWAS